MRIPKWLIPTIAWLLVANEAAGSEISEMRALIELQETALEQAILSGASNLVQSAYWVASSLAVIDLFYFVWKAYRDEWSWVKMKLALIQKLVIFAFMIGVIFAWTNPALRWMTPMAIVDGFETAGALAVGGTTRGFEVGYYFSTAFNVAVMMVDGTINSGNPVNRIFNAVMMLAPIIGTLGLFTFLMVGVFYVKVRALMIGAAGIIIFPWGASEITASVLESYLAFVFRTGVQYYLYFYMLASCIPLMEQMVGFLAVAADSQSFTSVWTASVGVCIYMFIFSSMAFLVPMSFSRAIEWRPNLSKLVGGE